MNADVQPRSRDILDGYLAVAPAGTGHVSYLDAFTRLRWMCVAIYMADRIARGIVRGGSQEANDRVLARAYAGMRR